MSIILMVYDRRNSLSYPLTTIQYIYDEAGDLKCLAMHLSTALVDYLDELGFREGLDFRIIMSATPEPDPRDGVYTRLGFVFDDPNTAMRFKLACNWFTLEQTT